MHTHQKSQSSRARQPERPNPCRLSIPPAQFYYAHTAHPLHYTSTCTQPPHRPLQLPLPHPRRPGIRARRQLLDQRQQLAVVLPVQRGGEGLRGDGGVRGAKGRGEVLSYVIVMVMKIMGGSMPNGQPPASFFFIFLFTPPLPPVASLTLGGKCAAGQCSCRAPRACSTVSASTAPDGPAAHASGRRPSVPCCWLVSWLVWWCSISSCRHPLSIHPQMNQPTARAFYAPGTSPAW